MQNADPASGPGSIATETCRVERPNSGFLGPNSKRYYTCGQPAAGKSKWRGIPMCQDHLDNEERQHRDWQTKMDEASKHIPGISWHNKGQSCGCGEFVNAGENHPWYLPWKLELEKWDEGFVPCLDCAWRWKSPQPKINCGAGCQDGWVPKEKT